MAVLLVMVTSLIASRAKEDEQAEGTRQLVLGIFDERRHTLSDVGDSLRHHQAIGSDGRATASQIASASAASFFLLLTYGLTN